MKVAYDPKTDTLSMVFKENTTIAESDEEKPGIILDYDGDGNEAPRPKGRGFFQNNLQNYRFPPSDKVCSS